MTDEERRRALIERWIEPHPWRRNPAEARLKGAKVSIWALIGYLRMVDGDRHRTAEGYGITDEEVEAALAYYHEHQAVIDARLAANAA